MSTKDRRIDADDVDDVIGIASEIARRQDNEIAVGDVVDIGQQLDLDADHVEQAIDELDARQRRAAAEAAARRRRRKRMGMAAGVAVAVLAVMAIVGQRNLAGLDARVDAQRAQVRSVLDRQAATEARAPQMADARERDAELAGAQNRVSVERRRYDQAAAAYNEAASAFPGSVWRAVFGMDARAPLSSQITQW